MPGAFETTAAGHSGRGWYVRIDFAVSKKGPAASCNVKESFKAVDDVLGERIDKQVQLFEAAQRVECAVCADVPNIMESAPDNE